MKSLSIISFSVGLISLLIAPIASATTEGWLDNLEEAKKLAIKSKRDIFINFTGSDW